MELKMRTETVNRVDYGDFERFVESVTGKEYEFSVEQEFGNDTTHNFTASSKSPYSQDLWEKEMEEIEAWISGTGSIQYRIGSLIDWLCFKGHIPPGNYCIEVCW